MVNLPRGKSIGPRIHAVNGKPVAVPEVDHFYRCEACGGMVDERDLAVVLEHEGPLPHPGQDAIN